MRVDCRGVVDNRESPTRSIIDFNTLGILVAALATAMAYFMCRGPETATREVDGMPAPHAAGGAEEFTVIQDNRPSTQHWEGSLASPAIALHPDDSAILVAANDLCEAPRTQVHISRDGGQTWAQQAELNGQYWSSLFFHRGSLYLLGTNREYGEVVIRKSSDLGSTWTEPTNSSNGLLSSPESGQRWHCAPMPVVVYNGRLWRCFEEFPARGLWAISFRSVVWSAAEDANLLDASSWVRSGPGLQYPGNNPLSGIGWLEGNICVSKSGIVALLRVHAMSDGKAAIVDVSEDGTQVSLKKVIPFPGGAKKFNIWFDGPSRRHIALSNTLIVDGKLREKLDFMQTVKSQGMKRRNAVAMLSSEDLESWTVHKILLYRPETNIGFQYPDFVISGEDMLVVFRAAIPTKDHSPDHAMAASQMTFHRIKDFRRFLSNKVNFDTIVSPSNLDCRMGNGEVQRVLSVNQNKK